ncbi:MAG: hypothetical protein OEM78_04575, partial [Gammaproteobacteria bacterium]|nr:hypothetical protein [Gammaproteobacteria bacterium]
AKTGLAPASVLRRRRPPPMHDVSPSTQMRRRRKQHLSRANPALPRGLSREPSLRANRRNETR